MPSYLDSAVNSTVRMGTLMPTPSVSVPQMTLSSPACARRSTSRRYFGSRPGVVHAHPAAHEPRERLAEPGGEAEVADQLGDAVLLLAGAQVGAHQLLGPLDGRRLGEVHDVDGRLVVLEQVLDGLEHRSQAERPVERHRSGGGPDGGGGSPGAPGEVGLEVGDVAEGRRHEDQLRVGEGQERHLPGPTAVGVGVEVELVHHRLPDVGAVAAAQGQVGEDLGRAADDRARRRSPPRRPSSSRRSRVRTCGTGRRTSRSRGP